MDFDVIQDNLPLYLDGAITTAKLLLISVLLGVIGIGSPILEISPIGPQVLVEARVKPRDKDSGDVERFRLRQVTNRDGRAVALDRLMSFLPANASPLQSWMGAWTKYLSPYDLNPLNINPLKDLVERFVDFEAIRRCTDLRLYISATNVHTGKLKVFAKEEITAEAVMASAALPYFFRAVEIDGVPYWDGGYTGNPPLYPLLNWSFSPDVLVVQINPLMRSTTPTSNEEILNRINEITFNSSLSSEIRVVELLSELLTKGELKSTSGNYRPTRLHRINFGGTKTPDAGSKFNNDFDFFETLHKSGRRAARRFLDAHFDDIGVRSTIEHLPEPPPEAASPDAAA